MRIYPIPPPPGPVRITRTASPLPAARPVAPQTGAPRRNNLWDRLCAAAVIAVVLATCVMVCGYAARELGLYREASPAAAGLNTAAAPAGAASGSGEAANALSSTDRTSLIAFSMGIDILIFVGLGLYLRWDMEREQSKTK